MPPQTTISITGNFERNLDVIQQFLATNEAPLAFDTLLDELFGTVLPNLERFPLIGGDFMARQPRAIEGINLHEALQTRIGAARIREYVHGDYLLLYALFEEKVYLLAIKHHRQLSFDLNAFWF
ncbi:MAG: type II toxin-antitoxin system RelE/ParE family toxin [Sulfuricella sp.]|nr:type II toxin-antitoxin system RelE/ParE family toxin [Sulfuricella sp.]